MSKRLYFLEQAQVCMSLAQSTNDPILKERLEDLAVDFIQYVESVRELSVTAPPLAAKIPRRDN
jgi:hypothetical protein